MTRFYKNEYPNMDEVVLVKIKAVTDVGYYVSLLEYDNMEGFILTSQMSRNRYRSKGR